jgi:hypothetical protein
MGTRHLQSVQVYKYEFYVYMCHVLQNRNVYIFVKPAMQNFTSQAEFCKPKFLPWQSGEIWSQAKSDSRISACLFKLCRPIELG